MIPKTMAVKITEKTYPIAVACLTLTFAKLLPENVIDKYYLVINTHGWYAPGAIFGGTKGVALGNTYLTIKEFEVNYYAMEYKDPNDRADGEFFEVKPKK